MNLKKINNKNEELNRKRKDMEWAQESSRKLREKSEGFHNSKKGSGIIRESRERK